MRIKELAELTGVTVRTVRYYHQIGLLPIPRTRDGVRDYDLRHVARVVRIRWLVEAGIGLSRIAGLLPAPVASGPGPEVAARDSVLADLRATVTALDEHLTRLEAQRDRMRGLLATVERGGGLTPLPGIIARFYDDLEDRAADRSVRRVIRRERDFVELAFYRGDMPPEATLLYAGLSDAARAQSLSLFGRIAARADPGRPYDDEEIEQLAAAVVERIRAFLGADLGRVFRAIDPAVARRAAELYVRLSDPRDRRADRAIADALLTAIEKEHLS